MGLLRSILTSLLDDLGYPASLRQMLAKHDGGVAPAIHVSLDLPQSIAARSVPAWHELKGYLTDNGMLSGWRSDRSGYYHGVSVHVPEYQQIARERTVQNWECDISQVDGFSGSKSVLENFQSTDEMVEANSRRMISEITPCKLQENLAHKEIRIIHEPRTSDCFAQYRWDKRTWLLNGGGSHHLAAAKYIAARLGVPVPLHGKLKIHELDGDSIASIRRRFDLFAISDDSFVCNAFHDAMRAIRASWLWHDLPTPYRGVRAVLLPKNEPRSVRVAQELRRAGVVDLGAHLAGLALAQLAEG